MARFAALLVLVAAVSGLACAGPAQGDGCPPRTCGVTSSAEPGAEIVVVRANGLRGPLTAYGTRTGRERFSLPSGIVSADGRRFLSARSRKGTTASTVYDARHGAVVTRLRLAGRWALRGVSATGRFAAFVGVGARRGTLRCASSTSCAGASPGRRRYAGPTTWRRSPATGRVSSSSTTAGTASTTWSSTTTSVESCAATRMPTRPAS